jgi:uncharacterized protein YjbJ (UPF0337 family)
MNWDQIEGKWKQVMGSAKQKWGKLTDNDWAFINGSKDKFLGRLQERYGVSKEEAQRQIEEWSSAVPTPPSGHVESSHSQAGKGAHR